MSTSTVVTDKELTHATLSELALRGVHFCISASILEVRGKDGPIRDNWHHIALINLFGLIKAGKPLALSKRDCEALFQIHDLVSWEVVKDPLKLVKATKPSDPLQYWEFHDNYEILVFGEYYRYREIFKVLVRQQWEILRVGEWLENPYMLPLRTKHEEMRKEVEESFRRLMNGEQ